MIWLAPLFLNERKYGRQPTRIHFDKHLSNLLLSNKQRECVLICFFGYGEIQKSHLARRFYSRNAVHQTSCALESSSPLQISSHPAAALRT